MIALPRARIAAALAWAAPFHALWLRERDASAHLRAELAQCRLDLAAARSASAGWQSHHELAADQRRRALDIAGESLIERWSEADDEAHEAYLRSLGACVRIRMGRAT